VRILAADDDALALQALTEVLRPDHEVVGCPGGAEALRELEREAFDLVLTDLRMPPPDGLEVVRAARALEPAPPVIVITALDSARAAIEALHLGASDYLVKPCAPEVIRETIARVLPDAAPADAGEPLYGLAGRSREIRRLRRLIPLLAHTRETVLIVGETGTGKELLARALHEHGPLREAPFVAHNMAATPSELAESLFFGHARGAFSGATQGHAGLLEQAEGGTLFLDEVDSFPTVLQPKLLRALESGQVKPVGSTTARPVRVRVLAASSCDLADFVAAGGFRADLYYRLKQIEVRIPPLRDRREDIPVLVEHFLAEYARETGSRVRMSPPALAEMLDDAWPGNCRELRSAVRSAAVLAKGGVIRSVFPTPATGGGARRAPASVEGLSLEAVEREHIHKVLQSSGGNRSRAARALGIDRGTLARKIRSLDLDREL